MQKSDFSLPATALFPNERFQHSFGAEYSFKQLDKYTRSPIYLSKENTYFARQLATAEFGPDQIPLSNYGTCRKK